MWTAHSQTLQSEQIPALQPILNELGSVNEGHRFKPLYACTLISSWAGFINPDTLTHMAGSLFIVEALL